MKITHFNWSADLAFSHMVNNKGIIMEYVNPFGSITKIMWNGSFWIRIDKDGIRQSTEFTSYMTRAKFRPENTEGDLHETCADCRYWSAFDGCCWCPSSTNYMSELYGDTKACEDIKPGKKK